MINEASRVSQVSENREEKVLRVTSDIYWKQSAFLVIFCTSKIYCWKFLTFEKEKEEPRDLMTKWYSVSIALVLLDLLFLLVEERESIKRGEGEEELNPLTLGVAFHFCLHRHYDTRYFIHPLDPHDGNVAVNFSNKLAWNMENTGLWIKLA